ncbi:MAG: hypothetical protein A3F73_09705 [Gallionellales bacterium RIFCSPLOWO2_12_FULL_59_22]|nr:MAG: hypothetical protein A3H99_05305 [Gallionellales bacterium RIFCSPLOWO2_02_FULL_59_110]OGT03391.1 MAG: hypothetical protein A2Z65_07430 [Gallionellales bacterium RIFCSPLOWO2_02_58_13]OGT13798.1 MAG: hypothetical protein A3F73_09705 [Gallionellales bacterium RIFCSPLOWO2_12_FULL_59_22]
MKKTVPIAAALLALISGCGGKESGTSATPAAPTPQRTPDVSLVYQPDKSKAQTAAPDLATGEKVYKSTCGICHKSGLKGAPRLGNKEDWEERLTQNNEVLYDRAINGYRGKKGQMPSRGSNSRLSDAEVRAAVDYMVVHAIPSWTLEK